MSYTTAITSLLLFVSGISNAAHVKSDAAHIDLTTEKVAHVIGEIDLLSDMSFQAEMSATAALPGDRLLIIDSPGGSVDAGQDMLMTLRAEKDQGVRLVCVVNKLAASMAFNILSACDVRLAVSDSHLLFHKIAVGQILPSGVRWTAANLRRLADLLTQADEPFRLENAKALSMSLEDYDFYADRDTWWTPSILERLGYLQGIATMDEPSHANK